MKSVNCDLAPNQLQSAVGDDECAREAKLGAIIEKSRATLLLHRFFTEGRVASQATLQPCNDSEYIGRFVPESCLA